ncbi:MAG TPA: radical SAM protein [Candidatus Bathyarchaeia archaeon]|nr:radical SAM protein [Candidatus Bathyarchaeia archaeon]
MIVRDVEYQSVLNRSALADYCINPYIGCEHGCKYCYAESYTRRFTKHTEPWGSFIDVKINAPTILAHEVKRKPKGEVYISSLTDAYQPLEQKHELTRKLLEILLKHQFPITIQTKSTLVLRDLDLIKKFHTSQIGFTITSLNDNIRKQFEPQSSTVEEKLQALDELHANNVKTYVFFGPVLPYLSDQNLEETLHKIAHTGVDYIYVDKLNLKPGLWPILNGFLDKELSDLHSKWESIFLKKNDYYADLKKKIDTTCRELSLECRFCY